MTIAEIKTDCLKRAQRIMNKTHSDGIKIIDNSFDVFYAQGNPKRQRKHILPGVSYTPAPTTSGDSVQMEIGYEGDQISYPPGDGTFSGGEVLGATMTGTYGVVGNPNYDEKAFEEIIEVADKNFAAEFN